MRVLVAYYSRSGMTRKACAAIGAAIDATEHEAVVEELVDTAERDGVMGWLGAGRDATFKRSAQIEPVEADVSAFDLVVVGTPVWAFTCTPAVRAFCEQFADELDRVAFVATMGGRGDAGAHRAMEDACGVAPVERLTLIDSAIRAEDPNEYSAKIDGFVQELTAEATA